MTLEQLKSIDEGDVVVCSYAGNMDLWEVDEIGWCGGYSIKLYKDHKVRVTVNYKDIRKAHLTEIEAGKSLYYAQYDEGEYVVLSFDKNSDDSDLYVIETAYIYADEDDELKNTILLQHYEDKSKKIYVRDYEIRSATPDEIEHKQRIWG